MKRRSPPLNALRVFECAARHESFTRAADELNLTQTAVSKQVANLEAFLGAELFHRHHRALSLTEAGRLISGGVATGMDHIEKTLRLLDHPKPSRIRVLCDVDFARLWLFPVLSVFEARHPEVQITLATQNYSHPIGAEEDFDLAISWGRGKWETIFFEPFLTNDVFPVCAPEYFAKSPPDPSQLAEARLIHDRDTLWWRTFFDLAGLHDHDVEAGPVFTQTSLCLDAAVRGDGVAMGDEVNARGYLEQGSLVIPWAKRVASRDAYYLLTKLRAEEPDDPVYLFREWLLTEAAAYRSWYSGFWRR